jgi:hypothetical protein
MLAALRTLCLVAMFCGVATAQTTDCEGCHGTIVGIGGNSAGVTVLVDNMSALSGSCGDTQAGQCTPTGSCVYGWDLVVLIEPASAAISRVKICPTDSRGRCIGPPAVGESLMFTDNTSIVRGYGVSCGWRHEQDILDMFGGFVGGISVHCSICQIITLPE